MSKDISKRMLKTMPEDCYSQYSKLKVTAHISDSVLAVVYKDV